MQSQMPVQQVNSMTGVLQRFNAQAITSTVLSQHALTAIEANVRASE